MRSRTSSALLLLGLLAAGAAQAHRQPECVTSLRWIESEQRLEISHRLHRHDAQLALAELLEQPGVQLEPLASRARMALYVESRFAVRGAALLPLTLLGAELSGDYLFVYQEYVGTLPTSLSVRSQVLHEWNPSQINSVLVAVGPVNQQLRFQRDTGWLEFTR